MSAARDNLSPQKQALSRYLDALLRDDWDMSESVFEPVDLLPPDVAAEGNPDPVAADAASSARADVPAPPPGHPLTDDGPKPDSLLPVWAGAAFEVQLLVVAGLTVGLPRSEIIAVVDSTELTPARADDPPWLLGAIVYRDGRIRVVDTASRVLPDNLQPDSRAHRTGKFPVAVIDNGRWGLACDSIAGVVTLDPGQVRWRTARTQRRWLAGMASQHGFALLDPLQLSLLLTEELPTKP
jgi:purine-binding chemotaxis protein CheW